MWPLLLTGLCCPAGPASRGSTGPGAPTFSGRDLPLVHMEAPLEAAFTVGGISVNPWSREPIVFMKNAVKRPGYTGWYMGPPVAVGPQP